jgi:hypothetical protein
VRGARAGEVPDCAATRFAPADQISVLAIAVVTAVVNAVVNMERFILETLFSKAAS